MNPWFTEVLDAHVAIENWLSAGRGDLAPLVARFSPHYSMITLAGTRLDLNALNQFFAAQRASRPGLRISVDQLTLVAEFENGAVVQYREQQVQPGQAATTRWSTVVFRRESGQLRWLHLHETLQSS